MFCDVAKQITNVSPIMFDLIVWPRPKEVVCDQITFLLGPIRPMSFKVAKLQKKIEITVGLRLKDKITPSSFYKRHKTLDLWFPKI